MPPTATTPVSAEMSELSVSLQVKDLVKSTAPIDTGLGFFNHMLDQFNSHAQIGVSVQVNNNNGHNNNDGEDRNWYKREQEPLLSAVGRALGQEIRALVVTSNNNKTTTSRFCCPLDEALVVCVIELAKEGERGVLTEYSLAPFGKYPPTGRTHVGKLQTSAIEYFWRALAESSGLNIRLEKERGDNAHHIVESSFKAFSRALRNFIDGENTCNNSQGTLYAQDDSCANYAASVALNRCSTTCRKTKETAIEVTVKMNGGSEPSIISTGIVALDTFWKVFAQHAAMAIHIQCQGDLWIDEHHTAEDVAIAVGQVLSKTLGTKAGLNRMWSASAQCEDGQVEVTMDLSNRPYFEHNLRLESYETDKVEDLSFEMFEHVLDSLVVNARMTVHVVEKATSSVSMNMLRAVAMALGQAFYHCASVDTRRAGTTASSKGTLSV